MDHGRRVELAAANYDKTIETKFQICKDPDLHDASDMEITHDEFRKLSTWLNRRAFLPFRAIDTDDYMSDICYFNATFNLAKIQIGDRTYGVELTMTTDSPFGYGEKEEQIFLFDPNDVVIVRCCGNEYGFIYPDLTIVCGDDGDLAIVCQEGRCELKIRGCSKDEIIQIDGKRRTIVSNRATHNIASDFNYDYLRLSRTSENSDNLISCSGISCSITLSYYPVIKDIPQ